MTGLQLPIRWKGQQIAKDDYPFPVFRDFERMMRKDSDHLTATDRDNPLPCWHNRALGKGEVEHLSDGGSIFRDQCPWLDERNPSGVVRSGDGYGNPPWPDKLEQSRLRPYISASMGAQPLINLTAF